jgi:hypothetical protein
MLFVYFIERFERQFFVPPLLRGSNRIRSPPFPRGFLCPITSCLSFEVHWVQESLTSVSFAWTISCLSEADWKPNKTGHTKTQIQSWKSHMISPPNSSEYAKSASTLKWSLQRDCGAIVYSWTLSSSQARYAIARCSSCIAFPQEFPSV